jgi:hypothetical protein
MLTHAAMSTRVMLSVACCVHCRENRAGNRGARSPCDFAAAVRMLQRYIYIYIYMEYCSACCSVAGGLLQPALFLWVPLQLLPAKRGGSGSHCRGIG